MLIPLPTSQTPTELGKRNQERIKAFCVAWPTQKARWTNAGGEDLVDRLWGFHARHSAARALIAGWWRQLDAFRRQTAAGGSAFGMAMCGVWVTVTGIGDGGNSGALWRGGARGGRSGR